MSKLQRSLWGRNVELEIVYDCYDGEEVLPSQEEAFSLIETNWNTLEDALISLTDYLTTHDSDKFDEKITNIFKYIIPRTLFIKRANKDRMVALMCDYRFDPEEGIALLFVNERLSLIGPQSKIL